MRKYAFLALGLALVGCGQAPSAISRPEPGSGAVVAQRIIEQVNQGTRPQMPTATQPGQRPGQQQPGQQAGQPRQPQSPFQEIAQKNPELATRAKQIETRLEKLDENQGKAMAGAMWEATKDKTLDQLRLENLAFKKTPAMYLDHWEKLLAQVENQTPQALQQLAAKLPPDADDMD